MSYVKSGERKDRRVVKKKRREIKSRNLGKRMSERGRVTETERQRERQRQREKRKEILLMS